MKSTDLLDAIGEVDSGYYEDMAQRFSGRRHQLRQFVSRFGAAAAVIAVVTLTAVTFAGIFREGIDMQQPAGSSTAQTASDVSGSAVQSSETAEPLQTLPTDQFEMAEETSSAAAKESAVTTTELILPFPADAEMPDNDLRQEVGNRFLVNSLSQSGVLAVTLTDAHLYDSLEDAGLTFNDLTLSFREDIEAAKDFAELKTDSFETAASSAAVHLLEPDDGQFEQNWHFIKAAITVENLNAVSLYGKMRGVVLPDGSIGDYSDFDFPVNAFIFGVLPDREKAEAEGKAFAGNFGRCGLHYNSAEGRFYDDFNRCDMIHLDPGEAITFEVGAFVPVTYTSAIHHYMHLDHEFGTDLKPYYMFGINLNRPYVEFHFDE